MNHKSIQGLMTCVPQKGDPVIFLGLSHHVQVPGLFAFLCNCMSRGIIPRDLFQAGVTQQCMINLISMTQLL